MLTNTKIFVNLPIKDLEKSIAFFTAIGFTLNKQFTNEKAASFVINDSIYLMLLSEEFFQTFTTKQIADTGKTSEMSLALSFESKEAVDEFLNKARVAGAKVWETKDYGFMYQADFDDLDGHSRSPFWMDPAQLQK